MLYDQYDYLHLSTFVIMYLNVGKTTITTKEVTMSLHYFRIVEGEALRKEGRVYRKDGGDVERGEMSLTLINHEEREGVEIKNCALRNVEFEPAGNTAITAIENCVLTNFSLIGNCKISNFDWGGRGHMAFMNAYVSGWKDVNILPSPEGKDDWDIITYPDIESYEEIKSKEGWYQAYATSKRNLTLRRWASNLREGWWVLHCYTVEGLEWIALHGNPDDNIIENVLYKHLRDKGYFYHPST